VVPFVDYQYKKIIARPASATKGFLLHFLLSLSNKCTRGRMNPIPDCLPPTPGLPLHREPKSQHFTTQHGTHNPMFPISDRRSVLFIHVQVAVMSVLLGRVYGQATDTTTTGNTQQNVEQRGSFYI